MKLGELKSFSVTLVLLAFHSFCAREQVSNNAFVFCLMNWIFNDNLIESD